MPHILFVLPYPGEGASVRFRVEQYLGPLREAGFTYTLSTLVDDADFRTLLSAGRTVRKGLALFRGLRRRLADLERAREADLVFIHREAYPLGPPYFERHFARNGRKVVYDFDDAVYLPKERAYHPWANRLRNPGKVADVCGLSRLVIAGNEVLAEYARARNRRVVVIPTPIDTERFRPADGRPEHSVPVMGWIGNPTGVPYLDLLRPVLRRLAAEAEFLVRVIGGPWECPGVKVEWRRWQRATEVADTQGFDIGLMPLPDSPWTRGKCSFKLIQYLSCGRPAVASPVGMNREVIREGENGFLASSDAEWHERLAYLLRDAPARERLGSRGREIIEAAYSVKALAPRLIEALRSAVREPEEPSG